jgi:hypothetical protein
MMNIVPVGQSKQELISSNRHQKVHSRSPTIELVTSCLIGQELSLEEAVKVSRGQRTLKFVHLI